MINACKNCGGELKFNIATQDLLCQHCDSHFDPAEYTNKYKVGEVEDLGNPELDITIYTCPSCGAQLLSEDQAAVDYCLYCGRFVTLDKIMGKIRQPDYIVPFIIDKEKCREVYKKALAYNIYAPSEFRNEKFLDSFKGIYVPFWSYEYTSGKKVTLKCHKEKRDGDYILKTKYRVSFAGKDIQQEINYDASSYFDDAMSRSIASNTSGSRKAFVPSYMFGFYGDTADVPDDIYEEEATQAVREKVWEVVSENEEVDDIGLEPPNLDDSFYAQLRLKCEKKLTLLPVWFLTWHNKDRLAYSVVNGDNGQIYAEVPVSVWKYLLYSLLTAVPLYFLLDNSFTFDMPSMLMITGLLSMVAMLFYSWALEETACRKYRLEDKGYYVGRPGERPPELDRNGFVELMKIFILNPKELLCALFIFVVLCIATEMFAIIGVALGIFIFMPLYSLYCLYEQAKLMDNKQGFLLGLPAYLAYFACIAIYVYDPPADVTYYYGALLCLVGVMLNLVMVLCQYNKVITRPEPHFFDRKAGV